MQIDWGSGLVEGGIAVVALVSGMYLRGRLNERDMSDLRGRVEQIESDMRELPERFVPRTELEARLKAIEQTGSESKAMLQWLILYGHAAGDRQNVPPPPGIPLAPRG